jgi:hypothetical protein
MHPPVIRFPPNNSRLIFAFPICPTGMEAGATDAVGAVAALASELPERAAKAPVAASAEVWMKPRRLTGRDG